MGWVLVIISRITVLIPMLLITLLVYKVRVTGATSTMYHITSLFLVYAFLVAINIQSRAGNSANILIKESTRTSLRMTWESSAKPAFICWTVVGHEEREAAFGGLLQWSHDLTWIHCLLCTSVPISTAVFILDELTWNFHQDERIERGQQKVCCWRSKWNWFLA